MNIPQIILLSLYFLLMLSCKDHSVFKEKKNQSVFFDLFIKFPGGCYNEVQMDNAGFGKNVMGFGDVGDTLIELGKRTFSISLDSDRSKILNIIAQMQAAPSVYTNHGVDLCHFILTVNGEKLFDAYRQDSLMTGILKTLAPYVRIENGQVNGGQCDFLVILNDKFFYNLHP